MESDLSLLQRYVADHDAEAFANLVRRYTGLVFNTAKRVTGNAVDAEDVVQECFLDLARQAAQIKDLLPAWLHCVATRRALNLKSSLTARRQRERAAIRDEPVRAAATISGEWSEIAPLVDQALLSLSDELRSPLLLSFFDGLSHDDIAARLGCSRATVGRRIETAIKELRLRLDAPRRNLAALPAILLALPRAAPGDHVLHQAIRIGLAGYGPAAGAPVAISGVVWWLIGGALALTSAVMLTVALAPSQPQIAIPAPIPAPILAPSTQPLSMATSGVPEAHGLVGSYFTGMEVTGPAVQRLDPVIDFNWDGQSPIPEIPGEGFSVRWSGLLVVPRDEAYTFTLTADDGVWLAIDGEPVLDAWYGHYADQRRVTVRLTSDRPHALTLDYFQSLLHASVRLEWESPSMSRQVVPAAALRPSPSETVAATAAIHRIELPDGWQRSIVGFPLGSAHADPQGHEFSLVSSGGTLQADQDAATVVSRVVSGPATLTARVTWLYPQHPGTCAGVMWRSSQDARAPALVCGMSPQVGIYALTRSQPGGVMQRSAVVPIEGSPWLRVQRTPERVVSAYSLDGEHWSQLAASDHRGDEPTTLCLVLVGGTATAYSGAVFHEVSLTADAVAHPSAASSVP